MPVATSRKPFVIPSGDELEQLAREFAGLQDRIERLRLNLIHATGMVDEPLSEFAEPPTYADIGALHSFADDVKTTAKFVVRFADEIADLLPRVNDARIEMRSGDDA